jgi:hypothetical protein
MTDLKADEPNQNDYIGGRMMMIIRHYGLNRNSFALKIGMNNNSLIVRITNNPEMGTSLDMIQKILNAFPEVNPAWFVMGRGEMLIHTPEDNDCPQCRKKEETITMLKGVIHSQEELIEYYKKLCSQ